MVKHNKQYYDDVYHLLKKQDIKHYKVYYGYAWLIISAIWYHP